jgi:feruloyl esterase
MRLLLHPLLALFALAAPARADEARCGALAGDRFATLEGAPTQIVGASFRPATAERRASCLVEGYVAPVVNFAMLLPAEGWNGRYMVRGCGGSCGAVAIELACALHLRDGYACLHTDMGHRSSQLDNNWVKGNLQGLVDFGYRATHVTTVAGKAVIEAFYGKPAAKSYFFGCSTGGRQGLIAAQRFPEDFDGIVAIAPASVAPFGAGKAASITEVDRLNLDAAGRPILPNRKALLVHRAAVAACDADDGIRDGLIGKPWACRFKPAALLCKGGDARDCLTAAQVRVVERIYARRGAMPGSELNWIGNYLRNAPLSGEASKPPFDLGVGRGDPATIETMIAPTNPDLRPFRERGGKLILVHGLSDHSTMPPPTIDYHETMTRTMGGPAATAAFARLFLVPGMDHCSGGEGAYSIDYIGPIVAWVEGAQAPEALRGVHPRPGAPVDFFGIDQPRLGPEWIAWERQHRAYPAMGAGRPPPAAPRVALPESLRSALADAEKHATAAGFPRRNVLNAMVKAMWVALYKADLKAADQTAAVAALDPAGLSPLGLEARARLTAELALD